MTLSEYALAYHECSSEELRKFYKARTGKDAPKNRRDTWFIRHLERLDYHLVFPFMDLPPELRVHVYEDLLTFDYARGRKPHPEILRANKLIHREAADIIYTASVLDLQIEARNNHPWCMLGLTTELMDFPIEPTKAGCRRFFRRFRKMQTVVVDIYIQQSNPRDPPAVAWKHVKNACLRRIVVHMKKVKRVEVHLHDLRIYPLAEQTRTAAVVATYEPLKNLPSTCVLALKGLTDATYDAVWAMLHDGKEVVEDSDVEDY